MFGNSLIFVKIDSKEMDECLVASEVEAESTGYYLRDVVVDVMEVVVDVTVCVFI